MTQEQILACKEAIEQWMVVQGLWDDTYFWTPEDSRQAEQGVFGMLSNNYANRVLLADASIMEGYDLFKAFKQIVNQHGFYFTTGYKTIFGIEAMSWHFFEWEKTV